MGHGPAESKRIRLFLKTLLLLFSATYSIPLKDRSGPCFEHLPIRHLCVAKTNRAVKSGAQTPYAFSLRTVRSTCYKGNTCGRIHRFFDGRRSGLLS